VTGRPEDVRREAAKSRIRSYGWNDLTEAERASLTTAAGLVDTALRELNAATPNGVLAHVDVVDFKDPKLEGLYRDGRIEFSRRMLASRKQALATLVHESAHLITGSGDGSRNFDGALEELWATICEGLLPKPVARTAIN